MRKKILASIEKNSRIDVKDLAVMLGEDEVSVVNEIAAMEAEDAAAARVMIAKKVPDLALHGRADCALF